MIGQPWSRTHHIRKKLQKAGIGKQKRKQLHAAGNARHKAVELCKCAVRMRGSPQRLEKRRHKTGQKLASPGTPRRADAAVMPAAHRTGDMLCVTKSHRADRPKRLGIVFDAGEDETARRRAERRLLLEQRGIVALHPRQMYKQRFREALDIVEPGKAGDLRKVLRYFRQRMRLLIVDHLKPMFEVAQEPVGVDQLRARPLRDKTARLQRLDSIDGPPFAERAIAAAQDQLLRLGEEFDLADAAPAELEVVARHRNRTMAGMGVDLALDGMNILDRRVVEAAPPHKRLEVFQKVFAGVPVSGASPRLDKGGALPVLSHLFVVTQRGIDGDRDLSRAGIRPQPEVDAEHIAVGRDFAEQPDEAANEIDGSPARVAPPAERKAFAVVEGNEIEIARVIQLECTTLAHGK